MPVIPEYEGLIYMHSSDDGKSKLISEIDKDARQEAEKIVSEARTLVEERRKYTGDQIAAILKEAREKARVQADAITNKILSRADIEIRRIDLQARNKMLTDIMHMVETELREQIKKPEYTNVLKQLIVEAGVGLGSEAVWVTSSAEEKLFLDKDFLSAAEKELAALSGQKISLSLSETPPLLQQGVVLTAKTGRLAFNNQIKTRMLRKQHEIQKLIYDTLFGTNAP